MQRLSGLDATFLYLESSSNLMHVASTTIFDPSTVPGGYSFDKVKELVASRFPPPPPPALSPPAGRDPLPAPPPAVDRGPRLRPRLPHAPGRAPDTGWKPDRIPTDLELVGHALDSSRPPADARRQGGAAHARSAGHAPAPEPPLRRHAAAGPLRRPRTPINGAISGRRKLAFTQVALDDVKTIKNALGGTVNDVVLALCAGALRSYLLARHELPAESLVAMVPISVRTEELRGAMGNQVSQMLVSLATAEPDPVARLRAISAGTQDAKDQEKAVGAETLSTTPSTSSARRRRSARADRCVAVRRGGGVGDHRRYADRRVTADVAQLVEHHLAKVRVAGSNPVVRSIKLQVRGPFRRASAASIRPRSTQTLYHRPRSCAALHRG